MHIARSWLFVPGNQPRMLRKASSLAADVLVFDLEDSVPADEKYEARQAIRGVIESCSKRRACYTRLAGGSSLTEDLQAVVVPGLSGLIVPKVESAADMQTVDEQLEQFERSAGIESGTIRLAATIETARGLLDAPAVAKSCRRMSALMFGAEDFSLDMGLMHFAAAAADDMLLARSTIAVAAASRDLIAIDRVVTDYRDDTLLRRDSQAAVRLGFGGKAVVHPTQIATVNQLFRPQAEDLAKARRIVREFSRLELSGGGAISIDGEMIDQPIFEKARRIVAYDEAIEAQD